MNSQLLILVVGHNASGKSTLSKKIVERLNINRVNGDIIRDMIISNIKYYSDTHYSYPNEKINSANKVGSIFRKELITELLCQNQSVLIDGAGITKKARANYLNLIKVFDKKIITIIIEVVVDEDELLNRLKKRDINNKQHKWTDFYEDIRKEKYESVNKIEANFIFKFNQHNSEEIIKKIESILTKTSTNKNSK